MTQSRVQQFPCLLADESYLLHIVFAFQFLGPVFALDECITGPLTAQHLGTVKSLLSHVMAGAGAVDIP